MLHVYRHLHNDDKTSSDKTDHDIFGVKGFPLSKYYTVGVQILSKKWVVLQLNHIHTMHVTHTKQQRELHARAHTRTILTDS